VGLEWGMLSLMSTIEELLERKSSCRNPRLRPYVIHYADYATPLYLQKLALSSPTSGSHSVAIVRLRTQATEEVN
jgi:hypothetical protein